MTSAKPPVRHSNGLTTFELVATIIALLIILGVVGQMDYETQRAGECHLEGKVYNQHKDICE